MNLHSVYPASCIAYKGEGRVMKKFVGILIVFLALAGCGKDGSTTALTTTTSVTESTAPYVTATSPADFAGGVAVSASISVAFSESMKDMTIAIAVSDGANTITGATVYGGKTALFTPAAQLLPNTTYTVTVASAAADLDGNVMRADYSWQFTTGDLPPWTGIKQFGTSTDDQGISVAVSGTGDVYVTGDTRGSIDGANAGGWDVFLAKYDSKGVQQWVRQFGSSGDDYVQCVAVSGSGEVYMTGYTGGSLGGASAGGIDVFLAKYDSNGVQQWIRQFGTNSSDIGYSVAVSGNDVYVAGTTSGSLGGTNQGGGDIFLAKYNSSGVQQTIIQYGTSVTEEGRAVVLHGNGAVTIAGIQFSNANVKYNVLLLGYDASLNNTYGMLSGGGYNFDVRSAAVNANGDVFVAGYRDGVSGGYGAFIMKYGSSGGWEFIDSAGGDFGTSITVSGTGDVYVAGYTTGSLWGTNQGSNDVFIGKYNANLVPLWQRQFGTAGYDVAISNSVAASGTGDVYVVGTTLGDMGGRTAGLGDAFIAKYDSEGNLQ